MSFSALFPFIFTELEAVPQCHATDNILAKGQPPKRYNVFGTFKPDY